MIKATCDRGVGTTEIEGSAHQILSELTMVVRSTLRALMSDVPPEKGMTYYLAFMRIVSDPKELLDDDEDGVEVDIHGY